MAQYGGSAVGFVLVDGYNLLGSDVLTLVVPSPESLIEETHGLGKAWVETKPIGLRRADFSHGGFYDDAVGSVNDAILAAQSAVCIGMVGVTGNVPGSRFVGFQGAFAGKYKRTLSRAGLHKADAVYTVTGQVDEGVVLQEIEAKTADWNTEGADSQDAGASSANGGAGYLSVVAFTGFSAFVAKVRHSVDDVTYADLVTFSNQTTIGAQRVAVAGTVNRHLAASGDVTGAGSLQCMIGFARG